MHNLSAMAYRNPSSLWCALLFLALLAWPGHSTRAAEAGYLFGVFPHLSSGQIEYMYAPITAEFSKVLGRPVTLKTKASFEAFTDEIEKETYDIAFVQPFDYVRAHDKHGYIPLARRGEPLSGVFAVKLDSPLLTLQDTKGKIIGLPPEVAAVSQLTKMALLQAKIDPRSDVKLQYYKAHDSCLQQLLIGEVDVCGTAAYPLRFFENKWNVKFRVLAETPSISGSVIVVHPRVSEKQRATLLKTILSWAKTESGQQLLKRGELKAFVAATDAEYDDVRTYTRKMQK